MNTPAAGDAWVNAVAAMGEGEPWLPLNTIQARGFQEIYDDIGLVRLLMASGVAPVAFVNGWALAGSKDSRQDDALCATTFQNIMQLKQAPLEGLKAIEPQLNDILKKYNP